MRLAVLADIHGSMPALEAVLNNLRQSHPDGTIVAGDMVGGPNSAEVVHRLQSLECWMIRGNNENYLLRFDSGEAPAWWYTSHQWAFSRWVYEHADKVMLSIIRGLPEQQVIAIPGTDPIRVVHGSPRDPNEHLYPGYEATPLEIALEQTCEPVLVCGHTHIPWQERKDSQLAFNPGAVCSPLNGDKGAQYALLDWRNGRWELEHRSVEYDFTLIQKAYQESGLLEKGGAFARAVLLDIQNGSNVTMEFLSYAFQKAAQAGFPDCEYIPDKVWDRAAETFDWKEEI